MTISIMICIILFYVMVLMLMLSLCKAAGQEEVYRQNKKK